MKTLFFRRITWFLKSLFIKETESQKIARKIMGKNFFGIKEAVRRFGVYPSRQQLAVLWEIPFSAAVLEQLKDTHVLVAVFPLSILEIRGKVKRKLFYNHEDAWYNRQAFAQERGETSWQLVYKTQVNNSTLKNWQEQQALLGKDDKVPSAQVIVYAIIGLYLATGERLFKHVLVRTSSVSVGSNHVYVGYFDSSGLFVSYHHDVFRGGYLGFSSARSTEP